MLRISGNTFQSYGYALPVQYGDIGATPLRCLAILIRHSRPLRSPKEAPMIRILILFVSILCSSAALGALHIRDLDGDWSNGHEGVYDDVLDVTWLADANLPTSNTLGVSGILLDGRMDWDEAEEYIAAMNNFGGTGYLGVNSWRQTIVAPVNGVSLTRSYSFDGSADNGYQVSAPVSNNNPNGQSAGFTGAELAYHYFNNLGGLGACYGVGAMQTTCPGFSVSGIFNASNLENLALFENLQNALYWTGTEDGTFGEIEAFFFNSGRGLQSTNFKGQSKRVWPVAIGDVGEPMAEPENIPLLPIWASIILAVFLTMSGRFSPRPTPINPSNPCATSQPPIAKFYG